jgi:hypothetical protein
MIAPLLVLLLDHRNSSDRRTISASTYTDGGSGVETGLLIQTSVGKSRWFGSAADEALRVKSISNIEHFLALPQDIFRLAIVNRGWRQQAYPRVTMLSVVPPKKTLRESTTVLDAPKAVRELRPIL